MSSNYRDSSQYTSRFVRKKSSVRSYATRALKHLDEDDNEVKEGGMILKTRNDQIAPWLRPYESPHMSPYNNENANKKDPGRAPKAALFLILSFFIMSGIQIGLNHQEMIASVSEQPLGDFVRGKKLPPKEKKKEGDTDAETNNNSTDVENDANDIIETEDNSPGENGVADFFPTNDANEKPKYIDLSLPNLDRQGLPVSIPSELSSLANIDEPQQKNEIAMLWHIPRSGGSTIKDIAAFCLDLTQASEVGLALEPATAETTEVVTIIDPNTGAKFINADTTTQHGLERARIMNIAANPVVDLIVSPYLYEAAQLFNFINKGRMFTLFRHPIERAVSMYYYIKSDPGLNKQIGDTIDRYAKSEYVENNWMTRFLSNKMGGELTPDDEAIAKEVLRTRCIVGLLSKKDESLRRFVSYFDWENTASRSLECQEKLLSWSWSAKNKHPPLEKNSEAWKLLEEHNTFDMRLYEYAKELFEYQRQLFHPIDDNNEDENGIVYF